MAYVCDIHFHAQIVCSEPDETLVIWLLSI